MGSIMLWHAEQAGLSRCCSRRCRTGSAFWFSTFSMSGGTSAGGFGGATPSSTSITYLPRTTGEVRVASDVSVSTLPCPSRPMRFGSVTGTRRKVLPTTFGMP